MGFVVNANHQRSNLALRHVSALLELDQYFKGFGDHWCALVVVEGFGNLEVVGAEAWIDQV